MEQEIINCYLEGIHRTFSGDTIAGIRGNVLIAAPIVFPDCCGSGRPGDIPESLLHYGGDNYML